ncbi:MAG: LVIVD repeat-containing protein [Gaiellaceae bacterium]
MSKLKLFAALAVVSIGIVASPLSASGPPSVPEVENWEITDNLRALGISPRPQDPLAGFLNSDLAFWGDIAFQGSYDGFRAIDINFPSRPKEIVFQPCNGNQGDVVVWDDVLIRSYNSPALAGALCDGEPIPTGFEGIHVFDISNLANPDLVATVPLPGGSHTATGVPDLANNRLILYNQTSGSTPPFISIVEVPLANPAATAKIGEVPLMDADACHDSGVILGKVNKLVCASHDHANVYDIGANDTPGGSLTSPVFLYTITEPGVGTNTPTIGTGNWHSASLTWDGKVIVLGWEPGGGTQPRCAANGTVLPPSGTPPPTVPNIQQDVHKSYFFYNAKTGAKLGQFVLPRPQTLTENCTIHNYTVVPLRNKAGKPRYVLVAGNYQSGISVVDFTNPGAAKEIAYADPPPLSTTQIITGGDWSTYWYNGRIYESDITRGLLIWRLDDPAVSQYLRTPHLNPQTQEFSID